MRVAIVSDAAGMSGYLGEVLKTWGAPLFDCVEPDAPRGLDPSDTPVVVCPAGADAERAEDLVDYARRGGAVICFLPGRELAAAAGLRDEGEKETPLRLRLTDLPVGGVAGDALPVVGRAASYAVADEARALAYLFHPGRYEGESVGVTETAVGDGMIVAFAFDLALCLMLLRQGDPARAPWRDGVARPGRLAVDIGPRDSQWAPYADLLARVFVEIVRRRMSAPVPLLGHMPGEAPGVLLYSGDEDGARSEWLDAQFEEVTAAGARMTAYLVLWRDDNFTPADVRRNLPRHDFGPHPVLPFPKESSTAEAVAEFERHVRLFADRYRLPAHTVRNHSTAWPGYLDIAEAEERLGVRMDVNFFNFAWSRGRAHGPYAMFGSAMPMRFCRPEGGLINVFQQHSHLMDDGMFLPTKPQGYKFSPRQFEGILDRIFSDIVTRFHTPYAVCMHAGGRVAFSGPQGRTLLRQARERAMLIWSNDQWLEFWDARDTWRLSRLTWDGSELRVVAEGETPHGGLRLWLPCEHNGLELCEARLDGERVALRRVRRYGESLAFVALDCSRTKAQVFARYS